MTVRIVDREVNPLIATKWYQKKIIQELPLVQKRADELKELNLPHDFIKRQTTDIISDCIRRVQCLYSWEKNSYTGIVYREEHFNQNLNDVLDNNQPLNKLKSDVSENSTVEHVIPVSFFKDKIFKLLRENKLNLSETEIVKAFLSPVALIDKKHTNKNNTLKIKDSDCDPDFPFKRYNNAGIKIFTHDGLKVNNNTWSMDDHWKLLGRTDYFKIIMEAFKL